MIFDGVVICIYVGMFDDVELFWVNNVVFVGYLEQGGWIVVQFVEWCGEVWFDLDGLILVFGDLLCEWFGWLLGFYWIKVYFDYLGLGEVYVLGVDLVVQCCGFGQMLMLIGIVLLVCWLGGWKIFDFVVEFVVLFYVELDNVVVV